MKTLRRHKQIINLFLVTLMASWQIGQPLQAATYYWDTDGSDAGNAVDGTLLGGTGNWNTGTLNWWPVPAGVLTTWGNTSADAAIFSSPFAVGAPTPKVVTLSSGIIANQVRFNSSGYTLTGGDLTLAGVAPTLHAELGDSATISSQILGVDGLTKTGGGTIRLSNNTNGYTGITSISNGSLVINDQAALGIDSSAIVVTGSATRGFGGGSLVLEGGYSSGVNITRGLSLQGLGPISDRSAALISVRNNTVSGDINFGAPLVNTRIVSSAGLLTLSGAVNVPGTAGTNLVTLGGVNQAGAGGYALTGALSGSGTLEKSGSGTLLLTPSSTAGFSGVVRISSSATGAQSTVRITSPNVLGTRTATTTGAVLDLNGGILEVLMDTPLVQAGGANALLYGRAGTTTIFVDHGIGGSAINGLLTFGAMAFEENTGQTFASRNGYSVTVGATPVQGGNNNSTMTNNLGGGGTLTFNGAFWSNADATGNRTLTLAGNGNTVINGSIVATGGSHSFVKAGTGTLTVTGAASSYTGNTTITGTLSIGSLGAINKFSPTGSVLLSTGTLNYTGITDTLNKPFSLTSPTASNAILSNGTGALTLTGNVGAGGVGAKTLFLGGTNTSANTFSSLLLDNNIGGVTTGPTGLTKIGSGTWVLKEPNPAAYGTATTLNISQLNPLASTSLLTLSSGTTAGLKVGQTITGSGIATPIQITGIIDATRFTVGTAFTPVNTSSYTVDAIPAVSTATNGGTWSGPLTIANGILKLAATNAASNIVQNTNAVVFNVDALNANQVAGGTLEFVGVSGLSTTETLGALTTTAGANKVILTSGGSGAAANLIFGTPVTPGKGSGLNFITAGGGGGTVTLSGVATSTATTLPGNGHFYINGADFARSDGGTLVAPVYGTDAGFVSAAAGTATLTAANHNLVTGDITAQTALSVTSLKMTTHALTMTGNLTVNTGASTIDGGILVTGGNTASISGGGLTTGGSGTLVFRVDGETDLLTLNSPMLVGTTGGFTKNGEGTLVLSGTNLQTGTTTINEGTVQLAGTGRLSGANQGLDLRRGATLDLNGVSTGTAIAAFNGSGTVTNTSAAAATLIVGNATTGAGTFSGIIQDGAGVVNISVTGTTGAPVWSGMNTYTGVTTIGTGLATTAKLVSVPNLANIGSASSIGRGLATSDLTNAASLVFGGLATAGINYTGTTSVSIDRLFTLNASMAGGGAQIANASANNSALIFNKTNAISFGAGATVAQTLTLGGASTGDSRMSLQLIDNGALKTNVSKIGAGIWHLGNATNSYTGLTTVTAGVLGANVGTSLPVNSPLVFGGGVLLTSGNFERNLVPTATAGNANEVAWTAGGGFAANDGKLVVALGGIAAPTALTWASGGFVPTGNLILNSGTALNEVEVRNAIDLNGALRTIQVDDNTNTAADFATITSVISGTGISGVSKTGAGILQLFGANTYTGNTAVTAGTVVVTSLGNSALGAGATSVGEQSAANLAASAITLGNGTTGAGILQYVGSGEISDRMIRINTTITGANQIHADGSGPLILTNVVNDMALGAKTINLRGSNTAANMITSALADNGGALGVTVDGGATWLLTGANTYSGTTTVGGGALGLTSDTLGNGAGFFDLGSGTVFAVGGDRAITNTARLLNNSTVAFRDDYSIDFSAATLQILAGANNVGITNNLTTGETLTFASMTANSMTGNRTLTINGTGDTIINGSITTTTAFSMPITYSGTGSLTLGGTGSNWNAGNVTVSSGTLKLGNSEVIPHGLALQHVTTAAAVVSTDTTFLPNDQVTQFTVPDTSLLVLGQVFGGDGVTAGSRIVSIDSPTTFTSVTASTTPVGSLLTFSPSGNVVLNPAVGVTATLDLNGFSETINGFTANTAGNIIIDNSSATPSTLTFGSGNQIVTIGGGIGTYALTDTGTGGLSIAKVGNAVATIAAAGTTLSYQGATSVSGGTLSIAAALNGTTSLNATNLGSILNLNGAITTPSAIAGVTVGGGATLNLFNGGGTPLANLTTLNLGAGSGVATLGLDVGSTIDTLTASAAAIVANTVRFNIRDVGLTAGGTYPLLVAPSGLTGTYTLGPIGGYSGSTLLVTDTLVQLNLGTAVVGSMFWKGNGLAPLAWNSVDGGGNGDNWSTTKDGLTLSAAVPGAATTVVFQADNAAMAGAGLPLATTLEQSFRVNNLIVETAVNPLPSLSVGPGALATNRITIQPAVSTDGIEIKTGGALGATISAELSAGSNQTWTLADFSTFALTGGVTLLGSPNVVVTSTTGLVPGMQIAGPGIPTGATITQVVDGTNLVISANATGANAALQTYTATSSLNVAGGLTGSGNITTAGLGRTVLSGTGNTYTGTAVNITQGILETQNVTALGGVAVTPNTGAVITVGTGGQFRHNSATAGTVANTLVLNGGTLTSGGFTSNATTLALTAINHTFSGSASVTGDSTIHLADLATSATLAHTMTLSGVLSGTGKITVNSIPTLTAGNAFSGSLTLSNANSGWSGGFDLQRGTITATNVDALGTGNITASAGRVTFATAGGTTFNLAQNLSLDAPGGVLELNADASGTPVSDMAVNLNGVVTLGSAANANVALRLFQATDNFSVISLTNSVVLGNHASISVGGSTTRPAVISGVISETGGARNLTINDDLGVWAQTNTTLRLTGDNTFTGGLSLSEGVLEYTTVSDIGGPASSLGMGTPISTGAATLRFIGTASQSTNRPNTQTGATTYGANGTTGAAITYAGAIAAGANNFTLTGLAGSEGNISGGIVQTGITNDATVNNGTWTLSGVVSTVADDFTIVGTTAILNLNLADGLTFGASADSTLQIQNGGTVNLGASQTAATAMDRLLIGQATSGANATLDMSTFNMTTARFDLGERATGLEGVVKGTGTLTVTADFNLYRGTINANLAGAGPVEKFGPGTVTLKGNNIGLTSTTAVRVDEGMLILDYTADNNTKLRTATGVDMRGGILLVNGATAAATAQTVGTLTLTQAANKIDVNAGAGQDAVLNLGGITRAASGGSVRLELPSGTQSATNGITTTQALVNGMLSAAVTVTDGTTISYATKIGTNIVPLAGTVKNDVTTWLPGENIIDDTTGFTNTAVRTSINSLTFGAATGADVNVTGGGVLNLTSGGVLLSNSVTAGTPGIFGGTLATGITDFILTPEGTQTLEVNADIRINNAVTKAGNGTLRLSGNNVYTGQTQIQAGVLQVSGGSAIGDNSITTLAVNQHSALQLQSNETIGRLSGGSAATDFNYGLVDVGNNTLTINNSGANTTYAGVFTGTGNIVRQGTHHLNLTGVSAGFTGAVVVNAGLLQLSGLGQINASSITVNKGGNLLIDNNTTTRSGTRILDTTPITLNSADGTFQGATLVRGLAIRTDQNAATNETVGLLNFNSGANYLTGDASGTTGRAALISENFVRSNNATMDVRARNLGLAAGDRNNFRVVATNEAAFIATMVGGGGAVTSQNISIIPWAIGEGPTANPTDTNMGNTFLTYAVTDGLRPLAFSEYDTLALAAPTDNVRESLAADLVSVAGTTVNSLVLHNNSAAAVTHSVTGTGSGQTLAVTSGAILFTLNSAAVAGAYGINLSGFDDGITTAGDNPEYVIHVVNPDAAAPTKALTATISSPLVTAADITKSGRGTLILSGVNTAGGGAKKTTINEGLLEITDLDNIGGTTGGLVFAGGTLRLGAGFSDDISTRFITFQQGGATLDTVTLDPILANSVGSGVGGLTKAGTGNLTLNAAATYTGTTTLGAGTITIGANSATGNGGDLNLSGGTTLALGTNGITHGLVTTSGASPVITGTGMITANTGVFFNHTGDTTIDAALAGAGGLLKAQTNTVTLTGASTYSGTTEVQAGGVTFSSISNVGGGASALGAPTTVENGVIRMGLTTAPTVLSYTGTGHSSDRIIGMQGTTGGVTLNGNGTGAVALGIVQTETAGNKTLTLSGTSAISLANSVAGIMEVGSVLSVTKSGTNTWVVNGANTYTGNTLNSGGGVLRAANSQSFGTVGTVTIQDTDTVLELANAVDLSRPLTVSNTGDGKVLRLEAGATSGTYTGNIANAETTSTNFDVGASSGGTLNLAGVISGVGGLEKVGDGTVILTNGNTYAGTTTVTGGTLQVGNGSTGAINGVGAVSVVTNGATLGTAAVLSGGSGGNAGVGIIAGATIIGDVGSAANLGILAPGIGNTNTSNQSLTFSNAGGLTIASGSQVQLGITAATITAGSIGTNTAAFLGGFGGIYSDFADYLTDTSSAASFNVAPTLANQDYINVSGSLTLGVRFGASIGEGNVSIFSNGYDLGAAATGDLFNLIDWVGSLAGTSPGTGGANTFTAGGAVGNIDLPTLTGGRLWDTSAFATHGIIVIVPEPSRLMLLMFGLLGLFFRRRRGASIFLS